MKKFYSTIMMLAMIVAALNLTACGGDDEDAVNTSVDDEVDINKGIVGVWVCTLSYEEEYGENGEYEIYEVVGFRGYKNRIETSNVLTINANKTFTIRHSTREGIYARGTYLVNGGSLILTSEDVTTEWIIRSLSSNELYLFHKELEYIASFSRM